MRESSGLSTTDPLFGRLPGALNRGPFQPPSGSIMGNALRSTNIHLARKSPCRGVARPAWDQRPFCMAFFSRRGRRDLFFGANFGIFVDFVAGVIWAAVSP